MLPIDRTEIETWGKRHESKGEFPSLISKLIFETTPRSTYLKVPSGSAVFLKGWDGVVHCQENMNFVPVGISLWEFKTNGDKSQAESDYNKRTENSLGFNKSEASFIFVTTNYWEDQDKEKWVEEKKNENEWADVRVYDSITLLNWLSIAEVTSKWFIENILGRSYSNCLTIEDFWEEWSVGPKGRGLDPELVLAGREGNCQQLVNFLQGEPNLVGVRASTKDEAIAFIVATVIKTGGYFKAQFYSKSLVIEDLSDFRLVKKNGYQLNLIVKFEDTTSLHSAVGRKHHVLLPLGPDDGFNSKDIIELPIPDRDGQIQALIASGYSQEKAEKFSREAGRDITILKKLLGFPLDKKKWQYQAEIKELVPALLIGRWNETNEGDRKTLEILSGEAYDSFSEKLQKWTDVESPPLMKIGSSWRLTSPLDAWTNLSNQISKSDFEKLKKVFHNVMEEINPVLELKPHERVIAPLKGKESSYSSWCREGITQSMILIGLHGDKLDFPFNISSQAWVDEIIKELLYKASGDLWVSRENEMPLIAEASPKSFINSVYHSLSLKTKPIMEMFREEEGLISPTSHHSGLLWALEGLAWKEEFLYDATFILARLSALDPGGKLANRPFNSLREIYKPWHYQTFATLEDRDRTLEKILKNEYEIGWALLCDMLPKGSSIAAPTHKMRWRLFESSFNQRYTWDEIFETHARVLDLLLKHFDYSENKLIDLLINSQSDQILPTFRDKMLTFIELNIEKINIEKNTAWHELRKILSRHRSYPDSKWALSEELLSRYENIYERIQPVDSIEKVLWMFNSKWPAFPEGSERKDIKIKEKEELIKKKRTEGLIAIHEKYGFSKLKELVKEVKEPGVYGDTLARIIDEEEKILELCEYLKSSERKEVYFVQQFIRTKSFEDGINWVFELFEKLKDYSSFYLARIFHLLDQDIQVWKFIDQTNSEISTNYWREMPPHFWGLPKDDLVYGINKLLKVKRFISALEIAYHEPEKLPSELLVGILMKMISQNSEEHLQIDQYQVITVIEEIERRADVDRSLLVRLEWLYLPFLTSYGHGHEPKVLYEELSTNPDFFIEILSLVYKSEKENADKEDIDESKIYLSKNGYELLRSWNRIPGVDEELNIDEVSLMNWISNVREKAIKTGRIEVADNHIGNMLAEYPEKEEPWPPREICKIIEKINTQSLKSGFFSGAFNKRSFSSRGPFDGGEIERGHAKYFRTQAIQFKYDFPMTAEVLNSLADSYERDAKRMDEIAEKDKLDF